MEITEEKNDTFIYKILIYGNNYRKMTFRRPIKLFFMEIIQKNDTKTPYKIMHQGNYYQPIIIKKRTH